MAIKQLSEEISSKIAAGEVVERPLSVVKELIENAIDANATEIQIRIEKAGMRLIEISDNGIGIPAEEVRLALHRYATSKIQTLNDLENIQSLGFRGEALASIAAVSRFSILTCQKGQENAIHNVLDGGKEVEYTFAAAPIGTRIKVEDLFFNTPARKKFLKKEITERRLIAELVSRYALYYSQIRFILRMEGRDTLLTSGQDDRREILALVYDLETARKLLEINHHDYQVGLNGYTSPVGLSRSSRKDIIFFINGRLVSDSSLTSAVTRAYHNLMMVGRFPISILYLEVPTNEIDVNVHPAKAEVRFQNPGKIFNIIHSQLRKTISIYTRGSHFSPSMWTVHPKSGDVIDPAWSFTSEYSDAGRQASERNNESSEISQQGGFIHLPILRAIGQIGRKYIVAEGPDGLYLIDQHAAHERILFEKLDGSNPQAVSSQYLLEPEQVQLNASIEPEFRAALPILQDLGFKLSEFGPNIYRIDALPAAVQHLDARDAINGVLEPDQEDHLITSETRKLIIARICKRAAIKAGQILSAQEQVHLVRDLESCQSPRTCPHGRPTMIHLPVDFLEKKFGRR